MVSPLLKQLLPPLPSEALKIAKEEAFVLPSRVLAEGAAQTEVEKFKTLTGLANRPESEERSDNSIQSVSQRLKNNEYSNLDTLQKDASLFSKALRGLSYIDFPTELAIQGIADTFDALVPGDPLKSGLGGRTESYEAWKELGAWLVGEQTLGKAASNVVDMFEERPWWVQIGTGIAYGVATGGVAAAAKGASIGARSLRYAMYAADPTIVPMMYFGKAAKSAFRQSGFGPWKGAPTPRDENVEVVTKDQGFLYRREDKTPYREGDEVGPRENPDGELDRMARAGIKNISVVRKLFPVHRAANDLRRLTKSILGETIDEDKELTGVLNQIGLRSADDEVIKNRIDIGVVIDGEFVLDSDMRRLLKKRDSALFNLSLGTAARNHEVERRTLKEINEFVNTGRLHVSEIVEDDIAARTGTLVPHDNGFAQERLRDLLDDMVDSNILIKKVVGDKENYQYANKSLYAGAEVGDDRFFFAVEQFIARSLGKESDAFKALPDSIQRGAKDAVSTKAAARTKSLIKNRADEWRTLFPDLPQGNLLRHNKVTEMVIAADNPIDSITKLLGHSKSSKDVLPAYMLEWDMVADEDLMTLKWLEDMIDVTTFAIRVDDKDVNKIIRAANAIKKEISNLPKESDEYIQKSAAAEQEFRKAARILANKQIQRTKLTPKEIKEGKIHQIGEENFAKIIEAASGRIYEEIAKTAKYGVKKSKRVGKSEQEQIETVIGARVMELLDRSSFTMQQTSTLRALETPDIDTEFIKLVEDIFKLENIKSAAMSMYRARGKIELQVKVIKAMLRKSGYEVGSKKLAGYNAIDEVMEELGIGKVARGMGGLHKRIKIDEKMATDFKERYGRELLSEEEARKMYRRMSEMSGILANYGGPGTKGVPYYQTLAEFAGKEGMVLHGRIGPLVGSLLEGDSLQSSHSALLVDLKSKLLINPVLDRVETNFISRPGTTLAKDVVKKIQTASNILTKQYTATGVKANTIEDVTDITEIRERMAGWLNDAHIVAALKGYGMWKSDTALEGLNVLKKASKKVPDMFGEDFASLSSELKEKRLEKIAAAIFEDPDGVGLKELEMHSFETVPIDAFYQEEFIHLPKGTKRKLFDPVTLEYYTPRADESYMWVRGLDDSGGGTFLRAESLVGELLSVNSEINRIDELTEGVVKEIDRRVNPIPIIGAIWRGGYAGLRGGAAGIVPKFIRAIHGREYAYQRLTTKRSRVEFTLQRWLEQSDNGLGYKVDSMATEKVGGELKSANEMIQRIFLDGTEFTPQHQKRLWDEGIREGNEFFTGIKVKDFDAVTEKEVREWAAEHKHIGYEIKTVDGKIEITDVEFKGSALTPEARNYMIELSRHEVGHEFDIDPQFGDIVKELTKEGYIEFSGGVYKTTKTMQDLSMIDPLHLESAAWNTDVKQAMHFARQIVGDTEQIAKTHLTQADVLLQQVHPKDWNKIYDLTEPQRRSLLFLKSIPVEMENRIRASGFPLEEKWETHGGKYIDNYFPRMARTVQFAAARVSEASNSKRQGVANNYVSFLEKREQPNTFNMLFKGKLERRDGMQERLSTRLAHHLDTAQKMIIDFDTKNLLRETTHELRGDISLATSTKAVTNAMRFITHIKAEQYNSSKYQSILEIVGSNHKQTKEILKNKHLLEKLGNVEGHNEVLKDLIRAVLNNETGGKFAADNLETIYDEAARIDRDVLAFQDNVLFSDKAIPANDPTFDWIRNVALEKADYDRMLKHIAVSDTDNIMKGLAERSIGVMGNITTTIRTLKAGFDLGMHLIHGFNSAFIMPRIVNGKADFASQQAWKKSVVSSFRFMANPDNYEKWAIDNWDSIESAHRWMRLGSAEPVEALQSRGNPIDFMREKLGNEYWMMGDIPIHRLGIHKLKFAHRFQNSFVGALDVLRIETWKGMRPTLDRQLMDNNPGWYQWIDSSNELLGLKVVGGNAQATRALEKTYHDLGAVINKMTGAYDPELAAATPWQRKVESSLIFFAPMYRRATFGIIADLRKKGVRQETAVRQLGGIVVAGALAAGISEYVLGNEGALSQPGTPNFGKFRIPGTDAKVGFGTAWMTILRLAGDITDQVYTDPSALINPDDWSEHPMARIIGRRGRAGLAPAGALLTDLLIAKRSYIGDPLTDVHGNHDLGAVMAHLGNSSIPFWADAFWADGMGTKGAMAFGEFFGLQTIPANELDKLVGVRQYALNHWEGLEELNTLRREAGNKPLDWSSLSVQLKRQITAGNPLVRRAEEDYRVLQAKLARGEDRNWVTWREESSRIDHDRIIEAAVYSRDFEQGRITAMELRDGYDKIVKSRRDGKRLILEREEFDGIRERMSELRLARADNTDIYYGDLLYDKWLADIALNKDLRDEFDRPLPDYWVAEAFFKSQITEKDWVYVKDRNRAWTQHLPVMRRMMEDNEKLRPYWNIHQRLFAPGSTNRIMANQLLNAHSSYERGLLLKGNPRMREVDKKLQLAKQKYRIANPHIDRALVLWYGAAPATVAGRRAHEAAVNSRFTKGTTSSFDTPHPSTIKRMPGSGTIYLDNRLTQL